MQICLLIILLGQEWMRKGMEYLDTHGEDQIQRGLSLLEQVDVEKAFDYGEQVVSDGDARALFISKAKDAALDFARRHAGRWSRT